LMRQAIDCGAAWLPGVLYDLGGYPGLVAAGAPLDSVVNGRVHGRLLRLARPQLTFRWLDPYEGIGRIASSHDPHVRVVADVVAEDSSLRSDAPRHRAWVYTYRQPTRHLRPIRSGRWQGGKV